MAEISLLKYIQWRPIGVCDSGKGKQRKAKIFSKVDLDRITSSGITRGNWRENHNVMKIIREYANDVAKLSTLTNGMKNPEVSGIKLVGAVLDIDQTPNLNRESIDGRVQFFEVSFKDSKNNRKKSNKLKVIFKWIVIIFGISVTFLFIFVFFKNFSQLSKTKNYKTALNCNHSRGNENYLDELKNIRKSLLNELRRLPEWLLLNESLGKCSLQGIGIKNQEKILLGCFISVRNRTKNIQYSSLPNLKKIEACSISLCQKNYDHLYSLCKRL